MFPSPWGAVYFPSPWGEGGQRPDEGGTSAILMHSTSLSPYPNPLPEGEGNLLILSFGLF